MRPCQRQILQEASGVLAAISRFARKPLPAGKIDEPKLVPVGVRERNNADPAFGRSVGVKGHARPLQAGEAVVEGRAGSG